MSVAASIIEPFISNLYNDDCNAETIQRLRSTLENQKTRMTASQFSDLLMQSASIASDLVTSEHKDSRTKSVGLALLDCLLDINDESAAGRKVWIVDICRRILESDRLYLDQSADIFRSSAACIGHLARIANSQEREFIQNFYNACVMKWLVDLRSENHRFAAVVSLRQLAINWPGLVYNTRKMFFSSIWDVMFDKVLLIREESAQALESVLTLFHQRGISGSFDEFLRLAIRQMEIGFQNTSNTTIIIEKIHGSMLIFESIINVIPANEFLNIMRKEFPAFIWGVLRRRDMKDPFIKIKVIEMIPKLALASSVHFRQENKFTSPDNFLTISSVHLLSILKLQNEYRQKAYISLGRLFLAMSVTLRDKENLLRNALQVIKSGFNEPFCIEALQCLAMVVKISPYMRNCVDDDVVQLTFHGGLTVQLIDCLKVFVKHAPDIRSLVQKRLLNNITSILQQHCVSLDDVSPMPTMSSSSASSNVNPLLKASLRRATNSSSMLARVTGAIRGTSHSITESILEDSCDKGELILALRVLASFDFLPKRRDAAEASKLLGVVREGAVRYLDDSNVTVRGTAAETCATVLNRVVDIVSGSADRHVVVQVMDRLLVLGVGDNSEDIRVRVFKALSPSLDRIVAESGTVHCVVEALNDESINVRAASMTVLARVAHYDSLHVMPLMHLSLSELIRQLQTSKNVTRKKESVQLLRAMVRGISKLIIPYAQQVLEPLLGLLDDSSSDIVGSAMATIGDLAVVAPASVEIHIESLFPRILEAMSDSTSVSKQTTATVTLGKMISSLCITSENYISHPRLFEIIVEIIQNSDPNTVDLRVQTMKTAGLLGAVSDETLIYADMSASTATTQSPTDLTGKAYGNVTKIQKNQQEEQDSSPTFYDQAEDEMTIDLYYLCVVMKALVTILRDSVLTAHHDTAAAVVMKIVKILKVKCLPQLDLIVEGIIYRLYMSKGEVMLQQNLLVHIVTLIYIFGRNAQKHVKTFVKVVCDSIDTHLQHSMDVVEALYGALPVQEFSVVLREVLPFMTQFLIDEAESNNITDEVSKPSSHDNLKLMLTLSSQPRPLEKKVTMKSSAIMRTLAILSSCLGEYRLDVITVVLKVMERPNAITSIKCESLCLVMQLVRESGDMHDFASRVVHPILRLLSSVDMTLQCVALTALSSLLCALGVAYLPFVIPARRVIQRLPVRHPQQEEYDTLVQRLLQQRPLPSAPASATDLFLSYEATSRSTKAIEQSVMSNEPLVVKNVDLQVLEDAWTLSGRATAADLQEWLRRMSVEFVKQSPSVILRPCAGLAQVYEPLASQLLNASFMSLWDHLTADSTEADVVNDIALINVLEQAFQIKELPGKIRHTLLNVAEFMEMRDKRLPLDIKILASQAEKANMLAISLRYRELEFLSPNMLPSTSCIEALITINNQLGLRESASGVLQHIRTHYTHVNIKPLWLEKLYQWADAKETYQQQLTELEGRGSDYESSSSSIKIKSQENWILCQLGMLRCLYALGEYVELSSKARHLQEFMQKTVSVHENYEKWICELQQLGAISAWKLGQWTEMEGFVENQPMSRHSDHQLYKDGTFFQAVLAIHRQEFNKALNLINQLRENAAGSIGSLLSDSFSRAHKAMATMQIITELEEVVEYKQAVAKVKSFREIHSISGGSGFSFSSVVTASNSNTSRLGDTVGLQRLISDAEGKKTALLAKWKRRWKKAPKSIEVYRDILAVRRLAIDPMEDLDTWLDLVSFCRKEQHALILCKNILKGLGAPLDNDMSILTRTDSTESQNGSSSPYNSATLTLNTDNYKFGTLSAHPKVLYAMHKYLWESNERERALCELDILVGYLSQRELDKDMHSLRVQCLLRRAEWTRILNENRLTDVLLNEVLAMVRTARDIAPDQYSVWHAWAVTSYYQLRLADAKETAEENAEAGTTVFTPTFFTDDLPSTQFQSARQKKKRHGRGRSYSNVDEMLQTEKVDNVTPFVVESIRGFIRSISLGKDQPVANRLQDTLRLLTLWFTYGSKTRVFACLDAELDSISAEEWLSVIPQLIARMHMNVNEISQLLRKVLSKVAVAHPQALVYPISVAVNNSEDEQQGLVAADVLRVISQNNAQLVSEAAVVSSELLRVAISPHEMWSEGLERAADMYMTYRNLDGMLQSLHDLNAAMGDWDASDSPMLSAETTRKSKPTETSSIIDKETLKDISFRHEYGRELCYAHEWLVQYERTHNLADLHQAWEVYHYVFKRISVQLKALKTVELSHVSPRLTDSKSLLLAVPGTYRPLRDVVRIASFAKFVDVISSKQRPRKLTIYGSDGNEYQFLLKGHEDLRQDERVMQLFGLINACLENNPKTKRKGFKIVSYTVLPLSNNAGVIGWVENCDTLNQLIKRYREQRKLHVDAEQRLLRSKAPDFEKLPLIHRIELFYEIQEETTGKDLAIMLWLSSKSSDAWVQRRANYTKSLAAMSMVGYILGLGDRHPSNLMLDRVSGRVVHIDFGDCFEVAMTREVFPETVPFRLTRMLVRSMEASGIEGTFRVSSETVMRILRENRDSVMAMLEAFVYDPLISWRLLAAPKEAPRVESPRDESLSTDSVLQVLNSMSADGLDSSDDALIGQRATSDTLSMSVSKTVAQSQKRQVSYRAEKAVEEAPAQENLNSRALEIINRIQSKLTGRDFDGGEYLTVEQQVERLILSATSPENLCQLFAGWCPFW